MARVVSIDEGARVKITNFDHNHGRPQEIKRYGPESKHCTNKIRAKPKKKMPVESILPH